MSRIEIHEARFVKAVVRPSDAPNPPRPTVVFAGRSNVGKSSLINCLTRVKGLARTSSTPGRTQEIIYFVINDRAYFADLPGYGFAKVPEKIRARWGPMIEGFITQNDNVRAVVVIVDARRGAAEEDLQLVGWLESLGRKVIIAATKCDKLKKSELARSLAGIRKALGPARAETPVVPFSSETREGRSELLGLLFDATKS